MQFDPTRGVRFLGHARVQMEMRTITEAQVERALQTYHTSLPARRLPGDAVGATEYIADIDGRVLKVYVENATDPPLVRTVAWRDWR